MKKQHIVKFYKYIQFQSKAKDDAFFDDVTILFQNSIRSYFISKALSQHEIVLNINKTIVEVIIDYMMYLIKDEAIDNDNDLEQNED